MADIIDSASEIEELQRNTAIKMRRLNYQTVSATHCCECGDPIDERRRPGSSGLSDLCKLPGGSGAYQ